MTIGNFKNLTIKKLVNSPSPQLDTEVLIEFFTGFNKTQQLLKRDTELSEQQEQLLTEAVEKRQTGLPVAYITNQKEFYGYNFFVTPDVLIPKPDTEVLVEQAINMILEKMDCSENRLLLICDMCTGSGCIGISVLKNLYEVQKIPAEKIPKFVMVDISSKALEIAEKNASNLLPAEIINRVQFIRSNLFEQVRYHFDIILTNPPYVPHSMVEELLKDGRSEPRLALNGDVTLTGDSAYDIYGDLADDGLSLPKNLTEQCLERLAPLGQIIMETGEYNAEKAAAFARLNGFKTELYKDLEGQLRGWIGSL